MANRINRRMVLKGAAGFTLAMPFLHSLAGRGSIAEAQGAAHPKRFVAFGTCDGGIWQEFMYPNDSGLADTGTAPGGHTVRRGALSPAVAAGVAALSPVLSASSGTLTASLASKLNVLRGLDVSFYMGHHAAGHLGNFGTSDQGASLPLLPTIDQVLANSDTFYGNAPSLLQRSMVIGHPGMSWEQQGAGITRISPNNNPRALFESIFRAGTGGGGGATPAETPPRPVVDLVLEDYRRLRESNRRLSSLDRVRLDDHMSRLSELERKLMVVPVASPAVSCGDISQPMDRGSENGDAADQVSRLQMFNDIVAAAFACDTSRIATFLSGDAATMYSFSDFRGDWHLEVAHGVIESPSQAERERFEALTVEAGQAFFEHVFLDLASKLDAINQGDGTSVLDSSLLQWTQEAGCETHTQIEMPVITAGSAGQYFKTGNYVDLRQNASSTRNGVPTPGVLYNQWLGNILQAMGLNPEEYNVDNNGGYGRLNLGTESWYPGYNAYNSTAVRALNDKLPFV